MNRFDISRNVFFSQGQKVSILSSQDVFKGQQRNLLSESAKMWKKLLASEYCEKIMCIGGLQTSHQLNYKWNHPLREWLLERAPSFFSLLQSQSITNDNKNNNFHFVKPDAW